MVSAPLTALILDRTFVSGSFREAFRRHGRLYLGLAASWVLLGFLIAQGGTRGGSTGFGIGVPVTGYWLTQFPAIIRYLRLAAWPSPLIFDYGFEDRWIAHPMWVLPYAVAIAVLAAAVAVALWRGWATGFLGFWFFSILAPTSLIPGGRQTAAEHRMYVALAPVAVFAVCGLYAVLRRRLSGRTLVWAGGAGCVVVAVALGLATARRNKAYSSEIALWQDTLQKFRNSPFAHNGIGTALSRAGRMNEAEREFREALRLKPDYFEAGYNLGVSLVGEGRFAEAKLCFEQVLSVKPTLAEAQNNLGSLLRKEGRRGEALAHYEKAVRLKPESAAFHINYAGTLVQENHPAEAIPEFRMALRFEPENAAAHEGLGVALGLTGRPAEALPELQTAVSLSPSDIESHRNLAYIYRQLGREAEAKTELERAAKLGAGGDQPAR
jgi:Flp pilus assembly protein TadD